MYKEKIDKDRNKLSVLFGQDGAVGATYHDKPIYLERIKWSLANRKYFFCDQHVPENDRFFHMVIEKSRLLREDFAQQRINAMFSNLNF